MSTTGFTCTASSEYNSGYSCSNVYDSNTDSEWATLGQGAGAWIEIQFPSPVTISKIETRYRYGGISSGENFKAITLLFTDGTIHSTTLTDGTNPEWNVVQMSLTVTTNSIKISATSLHGPTANPGFSEIRFYNCPDVA